MAGSAIATNCSRYAVALNRIKKLLATERAVPDLRLYATTYPGRRFDKEIDHQAADGFTLRDLQAVRRLGVSVSSTAREWLVKEGREEVRLLLQSIPSDLDIWEVPREELHATLGPGSPAWRLWKILSEKQQASGAAWKGGIAGELLHGKRPRLIPIYDQDRIGRKLGVSQSDIWEAMWCALRDPGVRQSLQGTQACVDEAAHLSLLRVLIIVIWMSGLPAPVGLSRRLIPSAYPVGLTATSRSTQPKHAVHFGDRHRLLPRSFRVVTDSRYAE